MGFYVERMNAMCGKDSTEILYDMFEKGLSDEQIHQLKNYTLEFIKDIRYKYNLLTRGEE